MIIRGHSKGACFLNSSVHSSHSGVSLALDIFISPGFLKCRVTHLIAGETFIVDGCHGHLYFLLNFQDYQSFQKAKKLLYLSVKPCRINSDKISSVI